MGKAQSTDMPASAYCNAGQFNRVHGCRTRFHSFVSIIILPSTWRSEPLTMRAKALLIRYGEVQEEV
jgi:hypothetical protein